MLTGDVMESRPEFTPTDWRFPFPPQDWGHTPPAVPAYLRTIREVKPERCACGNTTLAVPTPYHTHQVIELPPIAMEVTHWVLHQSWCPACGCWTQAQVPPEHA